MDHFAKTQPIALPLVNEMSEKEPLILESELPAQPSRPKKSKFKKALLIVVHLFLISTFLRWASHRLHRRFGHHYGYLDNFKEVSHHHPADMEMFPYPADLGCDSVAQWSDPEEIHNPHHYGPSLSSDASFTLPRSSESLLFLAHGSYSFGAIEFTEDDTDSLTSSQIGVYINVLYWNEEALGQANVCTLDRPIGHGVGFFTPIERHRSRRFDQLKFKVSVKFPKSSEPSMVQNLETSLPMFAHYFPKTNLQFQTLSVKSSNSPIHAESLAIDAGTIKTSNSPIKGNFTVTDTLELTTSNSPVVVNVAMYNADKTASTNLVIRSSNGLLASEVTLISTASEAKGGKFYVDARTSNKELDVRFPDAPVDSVLQFTGRTSNGPAYAQLHSPTFEGDFHIRSSNSRSTVDVSPDVEDPKNEGRERKVSMNKVGKTNVVGSVHWSGGDGNKRNGFAELTTSNRDVRLVL